MLKGNARLINSIPQLLTIAGWRYVYGLCLGISLGFLLGLWLGLRLHTIIVSFRVRFRLMLGLT